MATCLCEVFMSAEDIVKATSGLKVGQAFTICDIPAGATVIDPEEFPTRLVRILAGEKIPIISYTYEDNDPPTTVSVQ